MSTARDDFTDGICVFHEISEEDMKLKAHFHNSFEIVFILRGEAQFIINTDVYTGKPGCLLFISHLESHEVKVIKHPYERFYLLVKPDFLHTLSDDPRLLSIFMQRPAMFSHMLSLDENTIPDVCSLFMGMMQELEQKRDFYTANVSSLLMSLLIYLYRNKKEAFPLADPDTSGSLIYKVQKYIEENCSGSITLKDVSAKFYMSRFYLSHQFSKVCGYTFREYVTLQKLSKAKDLLVRDTMSITQVCTSAGFGNVNHFIRAFKKAEGVTPYKYRKIYRL